MSVLQPYIDKGKLVVQSKQFGMDKVSTLRWDGATAQARMDNLLSAYYTNKRVDRSEEHTSELQSLMRISYAVFCLKKKTNKNTRKIIKHHRNLNCITQTIHTT